MTPRRTFHASGARKLLRGERIVVVEWAPSSEMLNQQFGENSDFPCGVLTGWPHDEHASRRDKIARHNLNKGAGIQIALDEMSRKPSDAEPRHHSSGECGSVVRFEPPLRMNGNCVIAQAEGVGATIAARLCR